MTFRKYSQTDSRGIMKTLILVLFIFSINNLFSQTTRSGTTYRPLIIPQGFGISLLNSKGSSAIDNKVSNISFINPASISDYKNYSFALSYQVQTNISEAWIGDIGMGRVYNFYPQSVGGVYQYKNFCFGIGFGQRFNGTIEFKKLSDEEATNVEGIGTTYTPTIENSVHTYSIAISYFIKKFISKNSSLSVGLKYNLNNIRFYEGIKEMSVAGSEFGSNIEAGILFNHNLDVEKSISVGISLSSITEIEVSSDGQSELRTEIANIFFNTRGTFQVVTPLVKMNIPEDLRFDIRYKTSTKLILLGSLRTIFWSSIDSYINNQLEFSGSMVYFFSDLFLVSGGLFITGKSYEEDNLNISKEMRAVYITTGVNFTIDSFNVDIALADSHLFSGDYWKQTIGKATFGINL